MFSLSHPPRGAYHQGQLLSYYVFIGFEFVFPSNQNSPASLLKLAIHKFVLYLSSEPIRDDWIVLGAGMPKTPVAKTAIFKVGNMTSG